MSLVAKAWRYLRHGPAHLAMYVLGRFTVVRSFVQRRNRNSLQRNELNAPAFEASALERVNVEEAAKAIAKDGYCSGLRLRPEVFEKIRNYSTDSVCLAEGNPLFPFKVDERSEAEEKYGRKIRIGRIDQAIHECADVQRLADDPTIKAIAAGYLHSRPTFLGARIWWSFPANAQEQDLMPLGQGFHYDLDGYASVAFFFYLTDVDASTGPHVIVRGSHRRKPWRALLSLYRGKPDGLIEKWYGEESQVNLCGPAGSGFAEDLFCYHKGVHPERNNRLMLQLRYGLRRYYEEPETAYGLNLAKYGKAARA